MIIVSVVLQTEGHSDCDIHTDMYIHTYSSVRHTLGQFYDKSPDPFDIQTDNIMESVEFYLSCPNDTESINYTENKILSMAKGQMVQRGPYIQYCVSCAHVKECCKAKMLEMIEIHE